MWESEIESAAAGDRELGVSSTGSSKHHSLMNDGFERRDKTWFVTSEIPSDLLVKVGDFSFHLHKYPLLARSGRVNRIIYETSAARELELTVVELDDIPGGAESFELAAKFCYGIAVDLTASNISGLRCAAEYLEMTEDLEEGNLIFKTEAFLSYVVLSSWRDSIVVLKSCEGLSSWAENLQIVRRCSESIAWKACANLKGIRWQYTGRPLKGPAGSSPAKRNNDSKESSPGRPGQQATVPPDWWFEDVSIFRIDHFVRVVTAIKVKGMRFELIGAAIMHYAARWLPGLTKEGGGGGGGEEEAWNSHRPHHHQGAGSSTKDRDLSTGQMKEQRMIIESLISIIPPQKDSVSCSFLLRLLRFANMIKVAPALVTELEKRVGMQLEQAVLADLLIPAFDKGDTLYDVDLMQRLLEHFLVQEQTEAVASPGTEAYETTGIGARPAARGSNAKTRVARLLDSYLTEVARDRNLSLTKFQVLAEALPESARTCDDGLYRAVDSYLKAHPTLTEHERKRLCRVMDCQKLSIDACMHAAQNERLPLRIVVQVLFSEQVKISNALAASFLKDSGSATAGEFHHHPPPPSMVISTRRQLLESTPQSFQEGWAEAKKDINTLKFELESMKAKYLELQNDMDVLQRQLEKMVAAAGAPSAALEVSGAAGKPKQASGWVSGWRKLGKLARMNNEAAPEGGAAAAPEHVKKGPRRWRNSIS